MSHSRGAIRRLVAVAMFALALLAALTPWIVFAATQTLNGTSAACLNNANWSNTACWNGGAGPVPVTGDDVVIGSVPTDPTNYDLGANVQLHSITVNVNFLIHTINGGPIVLQSGGSITDNGSNGINQFPGVTLNGPTTFSLTGSDGLEFQGAVSGTGPLTLSGGLQLGVANSWTGGTIVNGTVGPFGNGAIPVGSAVTVNSGASLIFSSSSTIGSLSGAGTVSMNSGGSLTVGGNNTNTTFSGGYQDGSGGAAALTKTGTGTLTLSGTNTNTGATTVSAGTLEIGAGGSYAGPITVNSGTTLKVDSGATVSGNVTVNTGGTLILYGTITGTITNNGTEIFGTTTAITPLTASVSYGTSVTFTATVTSGAGTPTGSVTFTDTTTSTTLASGVALNGSGKATLTLSTLGAGSHTIQASFTGTGNFSNSSGATTANAIVIGKAALTVTATNASKTYGVTFAGTAFTTGTLFNGDTVSSVTLTSAGSAATATVAGSPYSIVPSVAAGTGLSNYTVSYVNGSLTVNTAPLTVTATNAAKAYGTTFSGTVFTTGGLVNSDTVTSVTLTSTGAAATATVAGSPYTLVPSAAVGTGLGNYTIGYVNGSLTVTAATLTVTASNTSKTYGATVTFAGTEFTTSGLANGDTVTGATLTSSGAAATAAVAGSPYAIIPSAAVGSGLSNYSISYVNGSLTVNTAAITVTASSASKTYGTTFGGTAFTTSGLLNGDTVASVTLTNSGTAATASVAGSPYTLAPSAAVGTGLSNYTIAYVNGTLTVTKATLTVTANNAAKIYGAALPTFSATITGFVNGETSAAVSGTASLTTTATASSAAGTYTITAAAGTLAAANYSFTFINGTLTISNSTLTVTAGGATRPYGTANSLSYSITGFVGGDTIALVTGSPSLSTTASQTSLPGSYPVTASLGTLVAANYTFAFASGTLTVVKSATDLGLSGITPGVSAGVGQNFTLNFITVSAPGGAPPSGTISYTVDGGAVQTATLSATGTATLTIAGLAGGTHTVVNNYNGDGNYLPTAQRPITLTVLKSSAQLAVAASASTLPQGQNFTLTLTVTGTGAASGTNIALTGTVTCAVDGGSAQTATLAAGGGTLTLSALTVGTHTVICSYSGDANYPAAAASALTLTVLQGTPAINSGGIVSAAGISVSVSPGGLATIFGTSLAGFTAGAASLPLPITLAGVQVLVNGVPAPLLYVSPTQINFVAPYATPVGTPVRVVVIANGVSSLPVTVTFTVYAPAVFTYQRNATSADPVIVHADNTLVTPDSPAQAGEVLIIYATGAGKLNNTPADGAPAPALPLATTVDTPIVILGGTQRQVPAAVLFSGLAPGFVGLLQINIQLPATLPPGLGTPPSLPVVISFPGAVSPQVNLYVK